MRGSGGSGDPDELEGQYSFQNSKILVDVNEDKEDLAIDLDKYK